MSKQVNLLTVDLEEWYVVEVLQSRFKVDDWPYLRSTVVENCRRLLHLFDSKGVTATWFVLGWVAEKHPHLIAEIADHGHEIGCHSYQHRRVDKLDAATFREDTQRAVDAILKACGCRSMGYRAPSWSLNASCKWAFKTLAELGFSYDSSIFPIKHDLYGMPDGPRQLFKMHFEDGQSLWEMPSSTFRLFGLNLPMAGGGYLRHSPYWYTRAMVKKLNAEHQPAMVYIHPWELDPHPPEIEGLTAVQRFRTYGSTALFGAKLERLLDDFEFTTISDYIRAHSRKPIGFERRDH